MGNKISEIKTLVGISQDVKHVLLVGLPKAGKTTFLYSGSLKGGWMKRCKGTKGFNYELMTGFTESADKKHFGVWDLGGRMKPLWKSFYENIPFSGIIFVIDADTEKSIIKSKKLLHWLVNEEAL